MKTILSKITNRLFYLFYMPTCRAYARHIMQDKPADKIMTHLCSLFFWNHHHYWPNFKKPRSLSEKVWCRMLYDRNPKLTLISDKFRVRDYVAQKVGCDYLIPLLWQGVNPEDIPFEMLPKKFVIKANHGCDYNIIVHDKSQLDQEKTKEQLSLWLKENFCLDQFLGTEWAYKNIKPVVIVESFIGTNEQVPLDYKFLCYSGHVEFVQVDWARFTEEHTRTFFDRQFNPLPFEYGKKRYPGKVVPPQNYEEMLNVAEIVARDFDFIRVDLYSVDSKIYFGELTCNPGGGIIRFSPTKYDYLLGDKWVCLRCFP